MLKSHISFMCALLLAALVFSSAPGCVTHNALKTGSTDGYDSHAHLEPQIQLGGARVAGTANAMRFLGIPFGATRVADGVVLGATSGNQSIGFAAVTGPFGSLAGVFSGASDVERAKMAAVLNAAEKAQTEYLVDPRYKVDAFRIPFLFSQVRAEVTGLPASVSAYRQVQHRDAGAIH